MPSHTPQVQVLPAGVSFESDSVAADFIKRQSLTNEASPPLTVYASKAFGLKSQARRGKSYNMKMRKRI